MKTKLFLFITLLLIIACSPSKRLSRLITHHPELITQDTLTFRDTIITSTNNIDTAILIKNLTDTIILVKDNLRITLKRVHDTLFIQGECKGDTIYIEHRVPVEKVKFVKPDKFDTLIAKLPWLIAGLIALVILGIFLIRKF
jgi:hypothetical protein